MGEGIKTSAEAAEAAAQAGLHEVHADPTGPNAGARPIP